MNFLIYNNPTGQPWDITGYIPQDSLSLLQAELDGGLLRVALSLELLNPEPDKEFLANIRKPGVLVIGSGGQWLFALYYNPVKTQYDPTTRRYRLSFAGLLEALKAYLDRERWWNVLDAAGLMATFKAFLAQYLPASLLDKTTWLPDSMSPIQEDPANTDWPCFAGFIQPASWLVGKKVDYGTNGPWTVINVLGIARSLAQEDTIFALCLAKPQPWWSNEGDYVLPILVKARWNQETFDWDIGSGDMYWHNEAYPAGWWFPLWFGLKKNLGGETGDSALIYTVLTPAGERVVCAWVESSTRKPGKDGTLEGYDYQLDCALRCVLLDGDLGFLDQRRLGLGSYPVPGYTTNASPQAIILRGGGYARGTNFAPAGVVFVGVNGAVAFNPGGGGIPHYAEHGQDGLCGIWALRWADNAWVDNSLQMIFADTWALNQADPPHPERLLDFEIFPEGDGGIWQILATRGIDLDWENLTLRQLNLALWSYDCDTNDVSALGGKSWELKYKDHTNPSLVFAVPVGPAYDDGEYYRAGVIFGYVIMKPGGGEIGHEGFFVSVAGSALSGPPMAVLSLSPDDSGYAETDINLTAGAEHRYDPRVFQNPGYEWDEEQIQNALASYLRTLVACRMRPFAMRYELSEAGLRRARFLLSLNSFSEYEVFALCADYDPVENSAQMFSIDGRLLDGELVPKIAGDNFNEAYAWRPLVPYPVIITDERDILSTGYDQQGNFGVFSQPVGWASFPVVRKVCENEAIYSDMGKLGYQNMMNPDYRYWWNLYNGQRGHLITPLSYWSFVQAELDYRGKTNISLIGESWDRAVHGISYVAGRISIGGVSSDRICLVLVPRWPLKGDTHTISGSAYWQVDKPYDDLSDITERQFSLDLQGTYWDALILGPEGGAILTNIWWDEEDQMDKELIVSLKELLPQWFGTAYWRGQLYTELLEYLREKEYELGGLKARLGLRELVIPVYSWQGPLRLGGLVNEDIIEDLEARGDEELRRYRDESGDPIPLFWQVVGVRWDLSRNTAGIRILENRDVEWRPVRV